MAKTTYTCTKCGATRAGWSIRCSQCGTQGTLEESAAGAGGRQAGAKTGAAVKPVARAATLNELKGKKLPRTKTGIEELDRVLGGGFVDGEVLLLAGEPGAGKSTLLLGVANSYAKLGKTVLYSSGEESSEQIAIRADRMGVSSELIHVIHETQLESVLGHVETLKPDLVIVDSLQMIASSEISGSIGGIQQSTEAANRLTRVAKQKTITMALVNQIVKSGDFAGGENVQHIADATFMLESDPNSPLRFLRARKNRFGSASEVGIFQHADNGLEEVADPSGILIEGVDPLPGEAAGFINEGMRQIPVEIQALATVSSLPTPRKQFSSVDYARGQIICAILDKFLSAKLYECDVFVSTVAGVRVSDPQADLATAAAILSSINGKAPRQRTMFIGELSLTGKVRGTYMMNEKIREASRLGFERIVLPAVARTSVRAKGVKLEYIDSVTELSKIL